MQEKEIQKIQISDVIIERKVLQFKDMISVLTDKYSKSLPWSKEARWKKNIQLVRLTILWWKARALAMGSHTRSSPRRPPDPEAMLDQPGLQ